MLMVHSREHGEPLPIHTPPLSHSQLRVDARSPGHLLFILLELGGGHRYFPRLCSQWNWASCWELDQRLNCVNSVHYTLTLLGHTYSQRRYQVQNPKESLFLSFDFLKSHSHFHWEYKQASRKLVLLLFFLSRDLSVLCFYWSILC